MPGAIALLLAAGAVSDAALAADFNPQGRRRRPGAGGTPSAQPGAARRAAPSPARPAAEAGPDVLIQRYLGILAREPGADFPLERLAQLYRERDGSLDALIQHFQAQATSRDTRGLGARLSLAGVYVHAGDPARAEALYEEVLAAEPTHEVALRKLAHLLAQRGDKRGARTRLEETLRLPQPDAVREQTLRSLIEWSLDLGELDVARKHHRQLVKKTDGSFFVRAELGRMLMERRLLPAAEAEYRDLVREASGDSRTLAPALRDLGRALIANGKYDEAREVLSRAERHLSRDSGLRLEVLQLLAEAHRAADRLPELVARLEQSAGRDNDQLLLLGGLYEEIGQIDRALATYEAALAQSPASVEVRLEVIQLLELRGELERVIEHYRKLTRIAPQNPDFAFRLANAHLQRGEQKQALDVLIALENRARGDEDTLVALVDFYERMGEMDRALALLERLARGDGTRHLVELGDRHFARGETERALAIWQRLAKDPNDAAALHTLGEVYLDHDLTDQALEAFSRAMRLAPERHEYAKSYGLALERAGAGASNPSARSRYYRDAQQLWEHLLARAGARGDVHLAREARQHIVTLWGLTGTLAERVPPLARRLQAEPPDLEAGRLLAETELRLRRHEAAEKTLRAIIARAPGDVESHVRLERALMQQGRVDDAIAVLERLCQLDPPRAKEYLRRMASYAAESYQDDRAIHYAARVVQLAPDDAEGHQRLGEMYRERQDVEHAVHEFRQALRKNDRLFAVHFQLAELLLNRQEIDEADQLLRHVVRACPDEQLIARAARLSMQIHMGRGSLESLEKELLPIALGRPNRPIYRRLLVELYGALAFPLVSQAKSDDATGKQAKAALVKLGTRAVKPLLDALGDPRDTQQRVAIELLSHIHNESAGPTLLTFAAGDAEPELRLRAVIAAGALRDAELTPKFEEFVFREGAGDSDPVSVAAVWALANLESKAARPALSRLLRERAPAWQALAVMGIARLGDARDDKLLSEVAGSGDFGLVARAAAAYALAERGNRRVTDELVALAESSDDVVRAAAAVGLAQLDAPEAGAAIARLLVSADSDLVTAGVRAACVLGAERRGPRRTELPVPDGRVDVRSILSELLPDECSPDAEARALTLLADDIGQAAANAVQTSGAQARAMAGALLDASGRPAFHPLTERLPQASAEHAEKARGSLERIAAALLESFLRLAEHPSPEMRQAALRWLASRPEGAAQSAVVAATSDGSADVQRTAIDALCAHPSPAGASAVAAVLQSSGSWSMRRHAARALEQMGRPARDEAAVLALERTALKDSYALVREAAARALAVIHPEAAMAVLKRLEQSDPEAQVRAAARDLLSRTRDRDR